MIRILGSAGLALVAAGQPLAAQPVVHGAELTARIPHQGDRVRVEMRYLLAPAGESEVPLRALGIGGAGVAYLATIEGGEELQVELRETRPDLFEMTLALPTGRNAEGLSELRLVYEVDGAVTADRASRLVSLPVVALTWPPAVEAAEQAFTGIVELEGGGAVYRSFPTRFERLEGAPARARYRATLPVVPAALRLHVATGAAPRLTVERLADISLIAFLTVLAGLGWRRFRSLLA